MMSNKINAMSILKKVDILEQELARLKRDVLHSLVVEEKPKEMKPSLFGRVRGGDVTEEMIEEGKRGLFRKLNYIQEKS